MRASDLAMYYQAVLHNPGEMWRPDVIDDARSNVRNRLPDVLTGVPANRTLGLVQAGDDGKANWRGLGRTVSPRHHRPQRRQGPDRMGRPGHRAQPRLQHQRSRPPRRPRAAAHHGDRQPRRGLRHRLTLLRCADGDPSPHLRPRRRRHRRRGPVRRAATTGVDRAVPRSRGAPHAARRRGRYGGRVRHRDRDQSPGQGHRDAALRARRRRALIAAGATGGHWWKPCGGSPPSSVATTCGCRSIRTTSPPSPPTGRAERAAPNQPRSRSGSFHPRRAATTDLRRLMPDSG